MNTCEFSNFCTRRYLGDCGEQNGFAKARYPRCKRACKKALGSEFNPGEFDRRTYPRLRANQAPAAAEDDQAKQAGFEIFNLNLAEDRKIIQCLGYAIDAQRSLITKKIQGWRISNNEENLFICTEFPFVKVDRENCRLADPLDANEDSSP